MQKYSFLIWLWVVSIFGVGWWGLVQSAHAQTGSRPVPTSQPDSRQVELANLKADVQMLDRRVREMSIAMEELMRRNSDLLAEVERQRTQNGQLADMVRQAQLARAISDLDQKNSQAQAELRRQIIREMTGQIEELGKQTQTAMDALARSVSSRPTPAAPRVNFSEDFPKEGVSYVVKSGDTLSGIASRHNSTVRDIQNANQITNPASIQVGQTLFIPQRQN
jgi:LysM repeat protein